MSTFDPAGTKPGLVAQVTEPKRHNIRCRNKNCTSIEVFEIEGVSRPGTHMYRCVKCHTTWGVQTGGGIDL